MRGTGFIWTLLNLVLMSEFKSRNPYPPSPKKLLSVIFKCVHHQHRVYGNSTINAVISPHLLLSFLLSSSSFPSLLLHLSLAASRTPKDVWKCGGNVVHSRRPAVGALGLFDNAFWSVLFFVQIHNVGNW